MAGPFASVTPGAGIRGVPNQNIRQVNDLASGQAQPSQLPSSPQQGQGPLPPQLMAAIMAQSGGQPQPGQGPVDVGNVAPRIDLASQPPALSGTIPAIPAASPAATPVRPSSDVMRLFGNAATGNGDDLAQQGRNGDDTVAHMQTGEINIPVNVQSPQLMQLLHAVFAQQGLDIGQFVVGSQKGSTNPNTGLQEFAGIAAPSNVMTQNPFGFNQVQPTVNNTAFTVQQMPSGGGGAVTGPDLFSGGMSGAGAMAAQPDVGSIASGKQLGDSIGNLMNGIANMRNNHADLAALKQDTTGQTSQVMPVQQQQLPA